MNQAEMIKKLRAVYDDDPSLVKPKNHSEKLLMNLSYKGSARNYLDPKYGKMIEDVMKEPWWKQNRRKKRVRHCYKPARSFR